VPVSTWMTLYGSEFHPVVLLQKIYKVHSTPLERRNAHLQTNKKWI
jgi:hypothetical protein